MSRLPRDVDPFERDWPWADRTKDVRPKPEPKVWPRPAPRQTRTSTFEADLQRVLRMFAE